MGIFAPNSVNFAKRVQIDFENGAYSKVARNGNTSSHFVDYLFADA